jgi:hypothetical protein
MFLRIILLAITLVISCTIANAAPLAPSKASQLVHLSAVTNSIPTVTTCTVGSLNGVVVDKFLDPEGTASIFAVPENNVLVINMISWFGTGPNTTLFLGIAGATDAFWVIPAPPPNADQKSSGVFHLPNIILKPGKKLCVAGNPDGLAGVLVAAFSLVTSNNFRNEVASSVFVSRCR